VVGDGRRPIVDTWWQTETGGILITPLPGTTALAAFDEAGAGNVAWSRWCDT
jgi:acyl-coenzyme A synthetase/AMP-(fatty) acid ligase